MVSKVLEGEIVDTNGLTAPQRAVIEAYPHCGNLTQAAAMAGLHRDTVYGWLERDEPGFADALRRAKDAAGDLLVGETIKRAMEGTSKSADLLLMFAVKAHRPEYREKYEVSHSGTVTNVHLVAELPTSDRLALLQMALEHESRALPPPPTDGTD